ncbi:MAG: glycosyltransferase [Opitutales bacterium]|nr:glycosyltransferase [Opitutales bacterium]
MCFEAPTGEQEFFVTVSSAKRRILLFQDRLRIGGTERQTLFLARWLQNAGHTVGVLVTEPGGELWDQLCEAGHQVLSLQQRSYGLPLLAPGLFRTVRAWQPDTILAMGRTANCYAGILQRAFPGVCVVGSVRTGKQLFPLHRWSLRHVRRIIVNSYWWKARLLSEGFPPEQVEVVRNALALEGIRANGEAPETGDGRHLRREFGVDPNACVFLSVAGFRRGKRQIDLLHLFSEARRSCVAPPMVLWLVGEGPMRARCERVARRLGLRDAVRFSGYRADPLPFYAAADVAVSASREDALPNFLVEAQASGLPFVAFDCAGVKECGQPGQSCVILDRSDDPGFINALSTFAGTPEMRREFGEAGRIYAAKEFDPVRQARLFESVLLR